MGESSRTSRSRRRANQEELGEEKGKLFIRTSNKRKRRRERRRVIQKRRNGESKGKSTSRRKTWDSGRDRRGKGVDYQDKK